VISTLHGRPTNIQLKQHSWRLPVNQILTNIYRHSIIINNTYLSYNGYSLFIYLKLLRSSTAIRKSPTIHPSHEPSKALNNAPHILTCHFPQLKFWLATISPKNYNHIGHALAYRAIPPGCHILLFHLRRVNLLHP
jgi:hypothetical protein